MTKAGPNKPPKPKQAVVLIHGMGEQVPMKTLRGFVEAVWIKDDSVRATAAPTAWSKPDDVSGDYELRRLTTAENTLGKRTDFFEFYWADLLSDTTFTHFTAWLRVLLLRNPFKVPPQLRPIWWTVAFVGLLFLGGFLVHQLNLYPQYPKLALLLGIAGAILGFASSGFAIKVVGDAARYLHVAPPNIGARRNIRKQGIALLEKLHDSGKYDRIIVVGHSLGSVIGYDILTHLWPKYNAQHAGANSPQETSKLEALEEIVRSRSDDFIDRFQEAQSEYLAEIRSQGNKWLVTDFVTLGSPLAHAKFLMAEDNSDFARRQLDREFPICPPLFEQNGGTDRFSFETAGTRVPHHGAVFAVTRWTNLYFPCQAAVYGDVIGGPVASVFGAGVRDIKVHTSIWGGYFSHTRYWNFPRDIKKTEHITALRNAVKICDRMRAKPYSGVHRNNSE
jgi:hypothetical protein